ncbi:MAG TPA: hypothetical protein VGL88_05930 [Pseudonocardiaceae bacterium]|jgi:predicted RNase H-like HicB family nuclease
MSDKYTAVYERDGDEWTAKIAEEPRVHSRCRSVPEARESIREALSRWLEADPTELNVVDEFRLPSQVRTVRESVKETRTEDDRIHMMASMTDPRSAEQWAEDMGFSMRDPATVEALKNLGSREVSIDTFCHTITMVEDLIRFTASRDNVSSDDIPEKE